MSKIKKISCAGLEYAYKFNESASKGLSTSHCHDVYEILFVSQGKGRYRIEGREFDLRPRTLMFIRPFQYHCVEIDPESIFERYVLHFPSHTLVKEVADMLERMFDISQNECGGFYPPEAIDQSVISLLDRIAELSHIGDGEKDIYVKLLLSELVVVLGTSANQKIAYNDFELGSQVIRYINDYIDKPIKLDDLAKKFFVSKYYLCRTFKKYSGVSVHAYISHKRVMHAKQLIESGETAAGAAYKVGFGDYSAFYRAYVKVLGKPPTSK